jgi:membrane protease YdiL (CAAX protease family)
LAVLVAALGRWLGDVSFLSMFMPMVAVLLMLFVVTREGYTRAGWQALGLHRLGWQRWALAVLGPLLVLSCTYSLAWSTGIGSFVLPADIGPLAILPLNLLISILINTLLGGLGEEVGWRGYLLPNLMGIGTTCALLVSGFLHGVWHLPLMLLTPFYHGAGNYWIIVPLFLLTMTAAGVFYGYLRLTSASVWPAALAHSAFNTFWLTFMALTLPAASPLALEYLAGESGIITLVGVVVMAGWLLYRFNRPVRPVQTAAVLVGEPLT